MIELQSAHVTNEFLWQMQGEPLVWMLVDTDTGNVLRVYQHDEKPEMLTRPPVPIEWLIHDYIEMVRANGNWAVTNVGTCADNDLWEVTDEIIDQFQAKHPTLARQWADADGFCDDSIRDLAEVAAKAARAICRLDIEGRFT